MRDKAGHKGRIRPNLRKIHIFSIGYAGIEPEIDCPYR
ncbi:hypothetical protein FOXG_19946 [Fusarium oxysporum f. sp. lycopersici 4287]|uniref:Uncharacterized protein n=2 Tax=Fusarium oxysporum TaxID=5507 RepID=A0A0J9WNU1_FUSO4|nr:hypothetical protein FOXG_19946 [Fusarium oxysporum f. sp. lycopersici 4287]EXK36787.1 hypothetical protein FOMG_07687 [Fusarium oxysporum f. sp. melonis 26406]KNB07872.1 hypothetical protein FOXG_19946 [Fusarium oxysporum f. sp. lycopersici 4287]